MRHGCLLLFGEGLSELQYVTKGDEQYLRIDYDGKFVELPKAWRAALLLVTTVDYEIEQMDRFCLVQY